MYIDDISRKQSSKIAPRGLPARITLTGQGLVLGAGTLLAKLDGKALPIEADQERISDYVHAANYAVGVYMAGLGYEKRTSVKIAQTYGFLRSSNKFSEEAKEWTEKGWEDAWRGDWLSQ